MDDTNLSREDEQQLREALKDAPPDLKKAFCGCWPSVKELLEWFRDNKASGLIKWAVRIAIVVGEAVYDALDCDKEQATA